MSFVAPAEVTAHEGLDLTAASSRTLALAALQKAWGQVLKVRTELS